VVTYRFLELHVGDFPDEELRTVLQTRSALPPSHCVKMVEIMRELQRRRQGSRVFSGKESFITVRDLLKLAKREPGSMQVRYCKVVQRPEEKKEYASLRSHLEDISRVVTLSPLST
jgi:midasin (ATPase involved in ribosome maturation)